MNRYETLMLKYKAEKQQIETEKKYYIEQTTIAEQKIIILDKCIKDLYFLKVEEKKESDKDVS